MGRTRDITDRYVSQYQQQRLQQTMTLGCAFCDWRSPEGQFGLIRSLAAEHRQRHHPEARQRTRRAVPRSGIKTISSKTIDESIALNRAQGASMWASGMTDEELYE